MEAGKPVSVSVDITNTGTRDGEEVVQLYVYHPEIKEGPIRTLQGYQRVFVKAGETARVTFDLKPENLAVYHSDQRMYVPEGEVTFSVGGSQPNQKRIQDARVVVGTGRITGEYTNVW
jgi:beta-glucosidase